MRKSILAASIALGLGGGYLAVDTLYGPPDDPLVHMLEVFDQTCMAYADQTPKPVAAPLGFKTYDHYAFGEEDKDGKYFYRNPATELFVTLSQHRCDVLYRNRLDLPLVKDLAPFLSEIKNRATRLSRDLVYEQDLLPNWPLYDGYVAGEVGSENRWGLVIFKLPEPKGFLQLSLVYQP